MRHVRWSNDALDDLESQVVHIARDNPAAARPVAKRIRETGTALRDFATGHPGRVAGTYEKSVTPLPYIIVYGLSDDRKILTIFRVIRTARDGPPGDWPE
jgi:plasmid stabilization system protein ParE